MQRLALLAVAILHTATVVAGGAYEPMLIEDLEQHGATSYRLVAHPVKNSSSPLYSDPYFGSCNEITIHGTYAWWFWSLNFSSEISRSEHRQALAHLQRARMARQPVKLGWMGNGLAATDTPCAYRSRALSLFTAAEGVAVVSLYSSP